MIINKIANRVMASCLASVIIFGHNHIVFSDATGAVSSYSIPENAIKYGPQTTRYRSKKLYTYFLPGTNGKHGPVVAREYYENLKLVERELYKDERKHGYQTEWYPNGRIKKRAL